MSEHHAAKCAGRRLGRTVPIGIVVVTLVVFSAGAPAAEQPEPASQPVSKPASFPLTEEQVMGPRFLDRVREAVEDWALNRYDPKTGGFGNLLHTADAIWSRYAVNAKDLGAPDRERIIACLDGQIPTQNGHLLWMSIRAIRILGGEPTALPHGYADKRTAESFGAFARDHIGNSRHHHVILGMLPLVVSSGDSQYVDALVDAIRNAPREKPELWPGDYSRRFAYSAVLLSAGKTPPWSERLLREVLPAGDRPIVASLFNQYHAMDDLFLIVRLPAALKLPDEEQAAIRNRLRAGLPAVRRAFLAGQVKAIENPHFFLGALCSLALLQEACPKEVPSERPYRWQWDNLELYRCKNFFPAAVSPQNNATDANKEQP